MHDYWSVIWRERMSQGCKQEVRSHRNQSSVQKKSSSLYFLIEEGKKTYKGLDCREGHICIIQFLKHTTMFVFLKLLCLSKSSPLWSDHCTCPWSPAAAWPRPPCPPGAGWDWSPAPARPWSRGAARPLPRCCWSCSGNCGETPQSWCEVSVWGAGC